MSKINQGITKKIWTRNSRIFPYFGLAGSIGHFIYFLFEYFYYGNLQNNFFLRVSAFFLLSLFYLFRKLNLKTRILLGNFLVITYVILELEIELHSHFNTYYFNNWFPIAITIIFHAIYLVGNIIYYIFLYIIYFIYFFLRVTNTEFLNAPIYMYYIALIYQVVIYLFFFVVAIFLFRDRYNQIKKNIDWKKDIRKRIILERELISLEERESILADIHDNVGGKLIEINLLISRLESEGNQSKEILNIKEKIGSTIDMLKNRIIEMEDVDFIRRDLYWGLKNYLVRRYSLNEREIDFQVSDTVILFQDKIKNQFRKLLYEILQEVVNNDLKYGYGTPIWNFFLSEKNGKKIFNFKLKTNSLFKNHNNGGKGNLILQNRIFKAGGTIDVMNNDKSLSIEVELGLT